MGMVVWPRLKEALASCASEGLLYHASSRQETRALRRHVTTGEVVEPFPHLFVNQGVWQATSREVRAYQVIRSLSRARPDLVFCSVSAACVYGLPVSLGLLRLMHIAVPDDAHAGRMGDYVRHRICDPNVRRVLEVPVTSFERTVTDCLLQLPFREGLVIADAALRMRSWGRKHLADVVERCGAHRPGLNRARAVCAWADARAESGGESLARAAMIEEGFEIPDLQVTLNDPIDISRSFRVDFLWRLQDGRSVAGELDGAAKYHLFSGAGGPTRAMMRERQREAHLTAAVDAVLRFDYVTVCSPGKLAQLLEAYRIPHRAALQAGNGQDGTS